MALECNSALRPNWRRLKTYVSRNGTRRRSILCKSLPFQTPGCSILSKHTQQRSHLWGPPARTYTRAGLNVTSCHRLYLRTISCSRASSVRTKAAENKSIVNCRRRGKCYHRVPKPCRPPLVLMWRNKSILTPPGWREPSPGCSWVKTATGRTFWKNQQQLPVN